jgi:hypothetical protein
MTYKLSDAQLIIMSAAAQRGDRCLTPSETLKGAALGKVATKLMGLGLAHEAKAKAGMPVWRRDDGGNGIALKLTAAGLKAIAIEDDREPADAPEQTPMIEADQIAAHSAIGSAPTTRESPRAGSKLALMLGFLQRPEGATVERLIEATGWLPHTVRAAFTGLRKRGYSVTREGRAGAGSIYRVARPSAEASTPTVEVIEESAPTVKARRGPKAKRAA